MTTSIYFKIIILTSIAFGIISCQNSKTNTTPSPTEIEKNEHDNSNNDHQESKDPSVVHLTSSQVKTIDIQYGNFTPLKVSGYINATGSLGIPPNGLHSVSAKAEGIIRSDVKFVEGDFVKKGSFIGYLENPTFIQQQQGYLESQAKMKYLKQELDRQIALFEAHAGIEKNVQKVQSEYEQEVARFESLKAQLKYIGIEPDQITPENLTDKIALYTANSGYISNIQIHNGMYVSPNQSLIQIIDTRHLHLELDVFEKDIAQIKVGQKISYQLPALGQTHFEGEVSVIGREFNTDNKTIRIHGHLEDQQPEFIKDLFVNARIWVDNKTTQALPDEAIVRDNEIDYIFVTPDPDHSEELHFYPKMVKIGRSENGFTQVEVIDSIPPTMRIVTQGAYYIQAQSKVGQLDHDH